MIKMRQYVKYVAIAYLYKTDMPRKTHGQPTRVEICDICILIE